MSNRVSGSAYVLSILIGLLAVALPSPAHADVTVLTSGRVNIDMDFDLKTGWDLGAHDEFTDIRYDPDAALFFAGVSSRRTMPSDPRFAFIGARPGDTVWVMPQIFDPARLSVGVSAEDIARGTFASYFEPDPRVQNTGEWVRLTFKDVRGPGQVSLWQIDAFGNPVLWMATSHGITDNDATFILTGVDADYNWGFTAPGIYEVDVQASAFLGPGMTDLTQSDIITYTFGVEVVP